MPMVLSTDLTSMECIIISLYCSAYVVNTFTYIDFKWWMNDLNKSKKYCSCRNINLIP